MKEVRKLSVIGQSKTYYITLPRPMVEKLKWRKAQKIEIALKGKTILLKEAPKAKKKAKK